MSGVDNRGRAATLAVLCTTLGQVLSEAPRPPTQIVLRSGGESIEVAWSHTPGQPPIPAATPPGPEAGPEAGPAPTPPPAAAPAGHLVRAPLVGTLYRAPEPGAAPFVEVGDMVRAGQQVAIIEAMKLMNPIEADRDGRVAAVLVDNGQGVEYDQPLLELDPDPTTDPDAGSAADPAAGPGCPGSGPHSDSAR
ncbi:acetyl-CoA carboxylase biotin carboxyl carrier protein [Embleya sp. NPDC008237]|uniref:acetyl-CoA carboxylase biotin carboxyl carrier protein n=1 Tax=Embleya sp. NPDC008237 TaxID=3363978 RepID=UPI0036EDBFAD